MIQRIMVALDGSRLSEQTIPYASAVARAFDAEIVLLRVVEAPAGASPCALESFDWRMERTEAIEYLEDVKRRLVEDGVSVDVDVTAGRPCEEILEMARARAIDLLVLASHGVGGLTEFRMASTAQKVVHAAETSVLIVPARELVGEERPIQTVLAPVDGTPMSDWATTLSATLARAQGAELVALHVVQAPSLLDPQGTDRERELVDEIVALNRGAASKYLDSLTRRLESPDLRMRSVVEVADEVGPVLERLAGTSSGALLVLSTQGPSRFNDGPCGALVATILANTGHPVLVLRQPPAKRRNERRWSTSAASADPRRAPLTTE